MNTPHPREELIQQFALSPDSCPAEQAQHIRRCPFCLEAVNEYRLLFGLLKEEARAVPGFDVSAAVLEKLPAKLPSTARRRRLSLPVLGILLVLPILSLTFFLKGMYYLFTAVSPLLLISISILSLFAIAFRIETFYRKFKKQMQTLDLG